MSDFAIIVICISSIVIAYFVFNIIKSVIAILLLTFSAKIDKNFDKSTKTAIDNCL